MPVRVGINGFGRIGRLVMRAAIGNKDIEFVGINDLVPPENLAYLLKYDSTHGRSKAQITHDDSNIFVDGKAIKCVSIKEPEKAALEGPEG